MMSFCFRLLLCLYLFNFTRGFGLTPLGPGFDLEVEQLVQEWESFSDPEYESSKKKVFGVGDGCDNIEGIWNNDLGSVMHISRTREGKLEGIYSTKVSSSGKAKRGIIIGYAPANTSGSTFGFLVKWSEPDAITVWTGQCQVCQGETVLLTSWLLRERENSCTKKWGAVRNGRDRFTRSYRPIYHHTSFFMILKKVKLDLETRESDTTSTAAGKLCYLPGNWYNDIGSRLKVVERKPGLGLLSGEYWTGREVQAGKMSGLHSELYGEYNQVTHGNDTLGFIVSWNNGTSVTAWVGQCHLCQDDNGDRHEVFDTTWFHRVSVSSCEANWKSTLYGQTEFNRHNQNPVRSNDKVFHEFGEDDVFCRSSGTTWQALNVLLMTGVVANFLTRIL